MNDNSYDEGWGKFCVMICVLLGVFLCGGTMGSEIRRESMRKSAVEAGVGRFIVKDSSGNTRFEWITNRIESAVK
jgi:hypothetical protein